MCGEEENPEGVALTAERLGGVEVALEFTQTGGGAGEPAPNGAAGNTDRERNHRMVR